MFSRVLIERLKALEASQFAELLERLGADGSLFSWESTRAEQLILLQRQCVVLPRSEEEVTDALNEVLGVAELSRAKPSSHGSGDGKDLAKLAGSQAEQRALLDVIIGQLQQLTDKVDDGFRSVPSQVEKVLQAMERHGATPAAVSKKVFLSYNSLDRSEVRLFKEVLASEGVSGWIDTDDQVVGTHFVKNIEAAITAPDCHGALVFFGENGIGQWQHLEINIMVDHFMVRKKGPLIPVRLREGVALPATIETQHVLEFWKMPPRDAAKEVAKALQRT